MKLKHRLRMMTSRWYIVYRFGQFRCHAKRYWLLALTGRTQHWELSRIERLRLAWFWRVQRPLAFRACRRWQHAKPRRGILQYVLKKKAP